MAVVEDGLSDIILRKIRKFEIEGRKPIALHIDAISLQKVISEIWPNAVLGPPNSLLAIKIWDLDVVIYTKGERFEVVCE